MSIKSSLIQSCIMTNWDNTSNFQLIFKLKFNCNKFVYFKATTEHTYIFINYIDSNICHGISLKKTFRERGDSYLRRRYQKSTEMLCSRPSYTPKKGCIKSGVKQHCLFPFVQAIFFMEYH